MKSSAFFLAMLVLLSSCYSYRKNVENPYDLQEGQRVKLVTGKKKRKGKFVTIVADSIVLKNASGKIHAHDLNNIHEIKKGKFSFLKTIGYPVIIVGGLFFLLLTSFEPNIGPVSYH